MRVYLVSEAATENILTTVTNRTVFLKPGCAWLR